MNPPEGLKIRDPMKEPAKPNVGDCCCYAWFGRKVKPQPTQGIPNTDGKEFQVDSDMAKKLNGGAHDSTGK